MSDLSPDTWLLDRLAPHTDRPGQGHTSGSTKTEDTDSGFDSLKVDLTDALKYETVKQKKCLIQEDEMQDDKLTRRDSRSDYRTGRRQFGRM